MTSKLERGHGNIGKQCFKFDLLIESSLAEFSHKKLDFFIVFRKMAKTTTIKEALKRWEEQNKQNAHEAKEIGLQFQWQPIEKMDNTLSSLSKCE